MAKDSFSFDIVSEVDMQEVRNAVDQAQREISQRFDFKDTGTSIAQDHTTIEFRSNTEDRLKAAIAVLKEKAVRREIPMKALVVGEVHPAAKGTYRQAVNVTTGIDEDKAKEITKLLRGSGLKVQAQIQGRQIRVSGKKKDDLQAAIRAVKEHDLPVALQFTNFRP
jgi:hypothetical protein